MLDFPNIPGYQIEKELGQGGMAKVYLAHEEKLDRQVALKVLTLLSEEGQSLAERFVKEARTAARLHHSHIITIHDVGHVGNTYYMAVEFLPGGTLKERIASGPLAPAIALQILGNMAEALAYAHAQGFVHRDIKPENIMFRHDGRTVLTDFGIARAMDSSTRLTKAGQSIGTPHYMSPEQARGQVVDARSDLYSLGIVLYEMLTGRVPFDAEDTVAIAIKHIQEPMPKLPAGLAAYQPLLDKLLAKDPKGRVQNGVELGAMIQGLSGSSSIPYVEIRPPAPAVRREAPPAPQKGQPTRVVAPPDFEAKPVVPAAPKRSGLVFALFALLGVLVVVLFLILGSGKKEPQRGPVIYHPYDDSGRKPPKVDLGDNGGQLPPKIDEVPPAAPTLSLRSYYIVMSYEVGRDMLKRNNFYDKSDNPGATGIRHQYEARTLAGGRVVVDHTTGLMWHQSGADGNRNFPEARAWVDDLNRWGYAGYSDWRLPTLEEAASLVESYMKNGSLYVDPVFSTGQLRIWTGDSFSASANWVARFDFGDVNYYRHGAPNHVRPVRAAR